MIFTCFRNVWCSISYYVFFFFLKVPGSPPNTRVEDPRNSSPALSDVLMLGLLFALGNLAM